MSSVTVGKNVDASTGDRTLLSRYPGECQNNQITKLPLQEENMI